LLVAVVGYRAMQPPPVEVTSAAVAPKQEAPAAVPSAVVAPKAEVPAVAPKAEASAVAPKAEVPAVAPAVAPSTSPHKMLEAALSAELQSGLVVLSEDAGRSVVALRDGQQFGSGRFEPGAQVLPVLERIGAALERVPGAILVRGYTDSLPVHPGVYASNLELSAARAQSVAQVLAAKLSQPQRVASEGAADADPIAPNDTEQNRARNRRVAIILGPKP
jgi:type VI secretion system protein ImpK